MRMLSEDGQMMRIMTLMAILEFAMGRGDNDQVMMMAIMMMILMAIFDDNHDHSCYKAV